MVKGSSIFFTIGILLLIDLYAFQVVKTLTRNLAADTRRILYVLYWAIPILSIITWFVTDYLYQHSKVSGVARQLVLTTLFMPYFAKFFAIPFLLLDDGIRGVQWAFSSFREQSSTVSHGISRSMFLSKIALVVGAATIGSIAYGVLAGAHAYRVRRIRVPIKNLPPTFEGIKIGQLSDIHTGSFTDKAAVKRGIETLMAEKPDIFVFTGDLVNSVTDEVEPYIDMLSEVKAPLGAYSILGNHDYGDYHIWNSMSEKQANFRKIIEAHKRIGWDLLMDEHRIIRKGDDALALIGIQNWGVGRFSKYGNLNKAYQGTAPYATKILLSHDPSHWNAQVTTQYKDIDLTLAGHTHGMQFGVEIGGFQWSPIQYRYKQWGGLYQEGEQYIYVNRGFGYLGYPGRIGMLPEITILTLVRAE